MKEDILERLWFLCNKQTGGNVTAFSKLIGVNQKTLSQQMNKECSVSLAILLPILAKFPDISAEWLFRGKGSMNIVDDLSTYTGYEDEDFLTLKTKYDKLKIEHDAEVEEHHKLIGHMEYLENYNQRLSQQIGHLEERLSVYEPEKKDII